MWELLKYYDNEGYLLSLSTKGEERWAKGFDRKAHNHNLNDLPKAQGFAIVDIKEFSNGVKLLKLRAPLDPFEWRDYSAESEKWTMEMIA
jgi:hypothetical protein